MAKKKKELPQV